MLQGIGLLMCVYLCFKGAEIWMIGATAPKELGRGAAWAGALLFIAAVAVAIGFAWLFVAMGATATGLGRF
jgi:NADH:ubiquinone oxidoreductase subunit K